MDPSKTTVGRFSRLVYAERYLNTASFGLELCTFWPNFRLGLPTLDADQQNKCNEATAHAERPKPAPRDQHALTNNLDNRNHGKGGTARAKGDAKDYKRPRLARIDRGNRRKRIKQARPMNIRNPSTGGACIREGGASHSPRGHVLPY